MKKLQTKLIETEWRELRVCDLSEAEKSAKLSCYAEDVPYWNIDLWALFFTNEENVVAWPPDWTRIKDSERGIR